MIQRQFSPGNLAMMGTSVWDGRESKKETKHPLQKKRERESKANKSDLCRNIVGKEQHFKNWSEKNPRCHLSVLIAPLVPNSIPHPSWALSCASRLQ